MNKKTAGIISIVIIFACIAYIIFDVATGRSDRTTVAEELTEKQELLTKWQITNELEIRDGKLRAVSLAGNDNIICGGDSFLSLYNSNYQQLWITNTPSVVTALAACGDTIYAATTDTVFLYDTSGKLVDEWGPYDDEAIITSIAANRNYIALADAGNKLVFILDRKGALESIIGYPADPFILPSPYFDVWLTADDILVVANTGERQIEFRTLEGRVIRAIGEEGDELQYFCGCCNPSHFTLSPGGKIITAEKGINRIKVLDQDGRLIEPLASPAFFRPSSPLDVVAAGENLVYAANSDNSTLYTFRRTDKE
ncbi:MAG: hypothetical protein RQ743_14050 [Bacteroidales bacterium]|nr:hypothetical protein [Bacteroidales bacterium]